MERSETTSVLVYEYGVLQFQVRVSLFSFFSLKTYLQSTHLFHSLNPQLIGTA